MSFIIGEKLRCIFFVVTRNYAVGLNFQGNSGGSGFYGVKGKKVIVLIGSEFLDGSCDWFIFRSSTPWQTTLTFRSLYSVSNGVVFSPQTLCAQTVEENIIMK